MSHPNYEALADEYKAKYEAAQIEVQLLEASLLAQKQIVHHMRKDIHYAIRILRGERDEE